MSIKTRSFSVARARTPSANLVQYVFLRMISGFQQRLSQISGGVITPRGNVRGNHVTAVTRVECPAQMPPPGVGPWVGVSKRTWYLTLAVGLTARQGWVGAVPSG